MQVDIYIAPDVNALLRFLGGFARGGRAILFCEDRLTLEAERAVAAGGAVFGVTVSEDGTELTLSHAEVDMLLALDCNDELEVLPLEGYPLTIEPIANDGGIEGINRFLIRKELYAPGMEEDLVELRFHRKGLANNYPEDRITLRLEANPSRIEGDFAFGLIPNSVSPEIYGKKFVIRSFCNSFVFVDLSR